MDQYRPAKKFNTPMYLYVVTDYKESVGVKIPVHAETGILFWGSFATYGGTERTVNDVMVVEDTATVETYYRPEFTAGARVALANSGKLYDIVGEPENVEQRNLYTIMKLTAVQGGA